MSLYRRPGTKVWTMDFMFHGQRIRETTEMTSITRAGEVQTKRKQELKEGTAGLKKREQPLLLALAAEQWQEAKERKWSPKMRLIAKNSMAHLLPVLGKRLLIDLEARDIDRYQKLRLDEKASGRSVNIEIAMLRQIMRKYAGAHLGENQAQRRHAPRATRLRARIVR